jgi:hypothetical protein
MTKIIAVEAQACASSSVAAAKIEAPPSSPP